MFIRRTKLLNCMLLLLLVSKAINAQELLEYNLHFTNKALQIQLVHAGDKNQSGFYLKSYHILPNWAGNPGYLLDKYEYGNIKVVLRDTGTNQALFSKSYNSLFNEWQTTNESDKLSRAFDEVVITPLPRHPVNIIVYERDTLNQWQTKASFPYSIYGSQTEETNKTTRFDSLIYKGPPKEKVDLVFLAEGYQENEMNKFIKHASNLVDGLFSRSPYNLFKDAFNIWLVYSVSDESGTDEPSSGGWKNTCFNTSFSTLGSERYLFTSDLSAIYKAASVVPTDVVCILVNTDTYGGGAIYNSLTVIAAGNTHSGFLLAHELGHGFAGLADEYYNSQVSYNNYYNTTTEPPEANLTTLVNFDHKWKHMIPPGVPIPTPFINKYENVIGVFEGGGYRAKGIYRPYQNCIMKSASAPQLCPVCQKTIIEIIHTYTK